MAKRKIKELYLSIIYESQWSLHVILIKISSRVWGWFALETLVWLGILSNFSNKLSHQLIKFLKGHLKIHHIMHIWSTMSLKSQENWRLASWLMVVGQMNSSDQNQVPLDPISYTFYHMKMIPREMLSRRPSGLRKTIRGYNSLGHRTTWLRSDLRPSVFFMDSFFIR